MLQTQLGEKSLEPIPSTLKKTTLMLAWKTPFATEALAPFFLPALVTLLCTFVYQRFVLAVGGARKQFKVPMPKVSGNDDFERVLRVQQNTLEQLPPFLTGTCGIHFNIFARSLALCIVF